MTSSPFTLRRTTDRERKAHAADFELEDKYGEVFALDTDELAALREAIERELPETAHALTLRAKYLVFRAQDGARGIEDERLRERVGKRLAEASLSLEAADNCFIEADLRRERMGVRRAR